jgi:hypothetical protein
LRFNRVPYENIDNANRSVISWKKCQSKDNIYFPYW